jgi:hypothetical protein
MNPRWTLALPLLLLSGCISSTLAVDIRTQIYADGSCDRRIEYRLERSKRENGPPDPASGFRQAPDSDPLRRFFRLPTGPAWTVEESIEDDLHVAVAQAFLPSPNEIGSDYSRTPGAKGLPARNRISFGLDLDESRNSYEYLETIQDPTSPMAAALRFAGAIEKRSGDFAEALERRLNRRIRRADARKAFRDANAPFVRRLLELSRRPLVGPRERRELEELLKEEGTLADVFLPLAPGVDREEMAGAIEKAQEEAFGTVLTEMEDEGLVGALNPETDIRFRATLVLPMPIVRANTCFQGDTATWEFTQEDLYGRGFEMWAKASGR